MKMWANDGSGKFVHGDLQMASERLARYSAIREMTRGVISHGIDDQCLESNYRQKMPSRLWSLLWNLLWGGAVGAAHHGKQVGSVLKSSAYVFLIDHSLANSAFRYLPK